MAVKPVVVSQSSLEVPSQDAGKENEESVSWYKFDNLLMAQGYSMVSRVRFEDSCAMREPLCVITLLTLFFTTHNALPQHTYYSLHS
jgi:hypothetical protein